MARGGREPGRAVLELLALRRRPGADALVPELPDAAVRVGAVGLRHGRGAHRRHHRAGPDPDRDAAQRERGRGPGQRRQGAQPRPGADHRRAHGPVRHAAAKGGEMAPIARYAQEVSVLRMLRRPPQDGAPAIARSGTFPVWRWVILLVAGVYFLLPLYAALRFAGVKAFGSVFTQAGFGAALWTSIQISAMTWIITMALMVPTTIYVHLRLPGMRRLLESITTLPIVTPPIVLTVGVLQVFPVQLKATMWLLGIEYVILAMPFAYRAIDAGLRSIDLKTLTEASSNLGGGWVTTMWRVVLPNLGTSLLSATVLIVALCLGEFTMASLNLVTTLRLD